jgi:putative ABC transport system substrate-binding protein
MLKKITIVSLLIAACAFFVCKKYYSSPVIQPNSVRTISICKVIEHEALDSVALGIMDYFKDNKNVQFKIDTCQNSQALALQIVSKFVNSGGDIFVSIGTMPAQTSFKLAKENKIKLVFSSVTNPSSIASSFKGTNTTGVSNFISLKPQVELFRQIQPKLKRLGIMFNTGESNSVDIVKKLKSVIEEMGIELVEQGIQKASDIPQAINSLAQKVDAVFISNDNTSLTGISFIVSVCNKNKIPVYVSDTDQVAKGCLAALGPNQYQIGVQTGKIVEKIIKGVDVDTIPVEFPSSTEVFINLEAAKELGVIIPKDVLDGADKIIGSKVP